MIAYAQFQTTYDEEGIETGIAWVSFGLTKKQVIQKTNLCCSEPTGWAERNRPYCPEKDADYPEDTHPNQYGGRSGEPPEKMGNWAVFPVTVIEYQASLLSTKGAKLAKISDESSEEMGWREGKATEVWVVGEIVDEDSNLITYQYDLGPKGWNRATGRRDQLYKKDENKPDDAPHMKSYTVKDAISGLPVKLQVSVTMLDQIMELGEAKSDTISDDYHMKVGQVIAATTFEEVEAI